VALIDETMARRYWPNGNAIGQFVTVFPGIAPTDEPQRQIIGIVRNIRDGLPLDGETRSTVFLPLTQMENAQVTRIRAFAAARLARTSGGGLSGRHGTRATRARRP
jgi:hypothetical protein